MPGGHTPFSGDTVGKLLFEHMTAPVPQLRLHGVDVPRALEEVIQRLLRKDPRDRYQSADGVLADLQAILAGSDGVSAIRTCGRLVRSAFQPDRTGTGGPRKELKQIDACIEQATQGQPNLILLEGESGSGKTRLLVEMARRAVQRRHVGPARDRIERRGPAPFQLLDGVVEEFVREAKSHPGLAEAVLEQLGIHRDGVIAALPHVADELGWTPSHAHAGAVRRESQRAGAGPFPARARHRVTSGHDHSGRLPVERRADDQAHRTLGHDCARKRGRNRAMCCWCSPSARRNCPRTTRCGGSTRKPTCVSARSRPRKLASWPSRWPARCPTKRSTSSGSCPEAAPSWPRPCCTGWWNHGPWCPDRDGWRVEPLAIANLQSSSQAGSFLTHRIELLPQPTIQLLSSGAVLGKEFDLAFAANLACQTPSQTVAALNEARSRHMVWVRANGFQCVFVHDKIREALLARLPTAASERNCIAVRPLHLQQHASRARLRTGLPFRCGRRQRTGPRLRPGGSPAGPGTPCPGDCRTAVSDRRARCAPVRTGITAVPDRGRTGRRADAAWPLRRGGDAVRTGGHAGRRARGPAQICGKLGELSQKRGAIQRAIEYIEEALRGLGQIIPRSDLLSFPLLAWELWVQLLHTLFPRVFVHRRKRSAERSGTADRASVQRTGTGLLVRPQHLRHACGLILREMNLAERYPPTLELAHAYSSQRRPWGSSRVSAAD